MEDLILAGFGGGKRNSPQDLMKLDSPIGWIGLKMEKMKFGAALRTLSWTHILLILKTRWTEKERGSWMKRPDHSPLIVSTKRVLKNSPRPFKLEPYSLALLDFSKLI
ncbi:hypothetical protein LIER_00983 [Lithospermum erythrorhizon]|uniref:Uncharacterized protein n=1 Tax=Lithospermum erythrorhizon TaxID=34254 RepID=A0AAV3NJV4_LITER